MKQNIQELREKMLEDYKIAVLECLSYKEDEIKQISKEYKINFTDDYRIFMQQFENFKIEDLEYILEVLDIEAENDYANANRCEATALTLWEYLKKINMLHN